MSTRGLAEASPIGLPAESLPALSGADFYFNGFPEKPGWQMAPVDSLTGMPLPILPPPGIRNLMRQTAAGKANWHHHYHPSSSERLTSVAGLAVRHVRLQLLPADAHHREYHRLFSEPENLPKTNAERFGHIVLACAGYIPPVGIDVYKDDPTEPVDLSVRMRHRLQSSGEVVVRGQTNIASFMKSHLVSQDFSNVKETIIEEFLETRSNHRKQYLGHYLLALASEMAVEPMRPVFQEALNDGLIQSQRKLPGLVKAQINGPKTSRKAIRALHRKLSKSYLQTGVDEVKLAA